MSKDMEDISNVSIRNQKRKSIGSSGNENVPVYLQQTWRLLIGQRLLILILELIRQLTPKVLGVFFIKTTSKLPQNSPYSKQDILYKI
jgi:hypothetical protein